MKKEEKNKTKNALIISIALIFISMIFLVGYTYAWFTDTATSGKNKITAGNLDVQIEYAKVDAERDSEGNIVESAWKEVTEDDNLFAATDTTLWEPGHTEVAYLRIKNNGSLALKYDFSIQAYGSLDGQDEKTYTNVKGDKVKLSNFLILSQKTGTTKLLRNEYWEIDNPDTPDVDESIANLGQLSSSSTGVILEAGESTDITLAVYMPTSVGNEANQLSSDIANGKPELYFGITVTASQAESESDTFGNDYDHNA